MIMKRRTFMGAVGSALPLLGWGIEGERARAPKYIFFMIGDGMGVAHRQVAEAYALAKNPQSKGLLMNHLPVRGMTFTAPVGAEITDSAAAGTALATGFKTQNRRLGLGPDSLVPLRTATEDALAAGKKVGLVTSVAVDHATPAAFYAKVPSREMYQTIDLQLATSGIQYVAGEPMLGRAAWREGAADALMLEAGYQLVKDRAGFDAAGADGDKVLIELPMSYALKRDAVVSLAELTQKGIDCLDGERGFFMMVEGGKIDWSGHANDLATTIHETLAFNEAVERAHAFYLKHPEDTLIVVTADHETGGLAIDALERLKRDVAEVIDGQKKTSGDLSAEVKQWAKSGSVSVDEAMARLVARFSLSGLTVEESARLRLAVEDCLSIAEGKSVNPELVQMYGHKNRAVVAFLYEIADRSGCSWSTFGHTAQAVETTAIGVGAERFRGEYDNTLIGRQLRRMAGS
jgi:alkaline phosphatase